MAISVSYKIYFSSFIFKYNEVSAVHPSDMAVKKSLVLARK